MIENTSFDVFIAYARPDAHYATQLHALLSAIGHNVFLDTERLVGGDLWQERIRQAQEDSLLTLILLSDRVDSAYFQQEEILEAIDLAREGRCKIVPIYLTPRTKRLKRHPLNQLHGIFWGTGSSLLSVAQEVDAALTACKRQRESLHGTALETVVIVTGCDNLPELFDRPSAYELKVAIDRIGSTIKQHFLRSIVMGDIWFVDHSAVSGHPNVISLGSNGTNKLSGLIASGSETVRCTDRWRIVRKGNRWALFGDRAEDTYDAVVSFKERDLPGFLAALWPQ